MRIKTMIMILIAVLLTVVIMQNTGEVFFNVLWATFHISKLWMLLLVAMIGFVIGFMVGRPGRPRYIKGQDEEIETPKTTPNTLSAEDRDYIS